MIIFFSRSILNSERVAEVDEQLGEMFLSDIEPSGEELMVINSYLYQ